MDDILNRLTVGTILRIGHPNNKLVWIKTGHGWIDNHGNSLSEEDMLGTLDHQSFQLLEGGG